LIAREQLSLRALAGREVALDDPDRGRPAVLGRVDHERLQLDVELLAAAAPRSAYREVGTTAWYNGPIQRSSLRASVLVADDHPVFCEAVAEIVARHSALEPVDPRTRPGRPRCARDLPRPLGDVPER
jgi:hypothetical protein